MLFISPSRSRSNHGEWKKSLRSARANPEAVTGVRAARKADEFQLAEKRIIRSPPGSPPRMTKNGVSKGSCTTQRSNCEHKHRQTPRSQQIVARGCALGGSRRLGRFGGSDIPAGHDISGVSSHPETHLAELRRAGAGFRHLRHDVPGAGERRRSLGDRAGIRAVVGGGRWCSRSATRPDRSDCRTALSPTGRPPTRRARAIRVKYANSLHSKGMDCMRAVNLNDVPPSPGRSWEPSRPANCRIQPGPPPRHPLTRPPAGAPRRPCDLHHLGRNPQPP